MTRPGPARIDLTPDPHDCDPLCPCPAGQAARRTSPLKVVPASRPWQTGALRLSATDEVAGEFLGQPFTGRVTQIVFETVTDDGPVDEFQHDWQMPVRAKLVEITLDEPVLDTRGRPAHRIKIDRDAAAQLTVTRQAP